VALPTPKPRAERQADVRVEREPGEAPKDVPSPRTRPVEVKVADEAVEAAAAPPPPPPPARPLENTPEPPKREAEKQPDPTPVPQPPRRQDIAAIEKEDAEALAKAEAQKAKAEAQVKAAAQAKAKAEADAKRVAEAEEKATAKAEAEARAKQMAELKAKADAKAKAEAEARAKKQAELAEKFNPGDISRLLQSREAPQSSGSAAREVQKTASLGTAAGAAQRLNPSQRDALMGLLRDQLHRCWQAPLAATTSDKPPVPSVRVKLNQDGSLAAEPAIVNSSAIRSSASSPIPPRARHAVARRCASRPNSSPITRIGRTSWSTSIRVRWADHPNPEQRCPRAHPCA
jgi:colicin import membrane protein